MADLEDAFFVLKSFLASVNPLRASTSATPQSQPQSIAIRSLKLPDIKLPEFSGSILKWYSFYDTFESLVHNNRDLSDVQKFHYLKTTLRGEALKLIEKISVTGTNYSVALKVITDRYQNKNILIRNHIEALFKVAAVKKECPRALTSLIGEFENNLGILEKLGEDVKGWSSLLLVMVITRLDAATLREWQRVAEKKRMPTYDELIEFLRDYVMELETLQADRPTQESKPHPQSYNASTSSGSGYRPSDSSSSRPSSRYSCAGCGGKGHQLYYCETFKSMPLLKRTEVVSKAGICSNCLNGKHPSATCEFGTCRRCNGRHHTLLHQPQKDSSSSSSGQKKPSSSNLVVRETSSSSTSNVGQSASDPTLSSQSANSLSVTSRSDPSLPSQVFLATAIVKVFGPKGSSFLARALLDNASQPNLMTERFRHLINARKTPDSMEIAGVGGDISAVSSYSTVATIGSRFNSFRTALEFVVMDRVTNDLPSYTVDTSDWVIPENIRLADPSFATKGPIDIVVGAQVFFDLLRNGHHSIAEDKPKLHNSVFGWLVSGTHQRSNSRGPARLNCHLSTYPELEKLVSRFWELESCVSGPAWSMEEKLCEKVFESTVRRDPSGRYVVALLKKAEYDGQLGSSRSIATRRFHYMEKRFKSNPALQFQYSAFMQEYLTLGHMKLVDAVEDSPGHHFYLPHHAVLRPDSTTTKLRVVFDGSCKTTSGFSLNDVLLKGPVIQDDMIANLVRFRFKPVVVTADVEKMYRQVLVAPEDQALQQILWRDSPDEPLRTYKLTTVTYGTTSAPFLATRCLKQVAIDEGKNFPAAVPVVEHGFYVDDLMYGFDSVEEAIDASRQTSEMLATIGFPLRKWSSNRPEVIEQFPPDHREKATVFELDRSDPVKALGLLWRPDTDDLLFKIPEWPEHTIATKRNIVSHTCSFFDPLGCYGPVTVKNKMLIQTLWERSIDWDHVLPEDLQHHWIELVEKLRMLKQLVVPRFALVDKVETTQLHGFSDASTRAYGACIYVHCTTTSGAVVTRLLISKSRIAPTRKKVTLARLELCAALLLSTLMKKVTEWLEIAVPIYLWSDATITLHWIAGNPSSWDTFVANRVAQVQDVSPTATWLHVPTADNPADHISRGLAPADLLSNSLWWNGPDWLSLPTSSWPETAFKWRSSIPPDDDMERRKTVVVAACTKSTADKWFQHEFAGYTSYLDTLRVLALCRRFAQNCRLKKAKAARITGFLTPVDVRSEEAALMRIIQASEFPDEYEKLKADLPIGRKSALRSLRPMMVKDEAIIRVGGRLKNAPIPFGRKHPILLPRNHLATSLIFADHHESTLHGPPSQLLAAVRRRYWPIDGRNKARYVVHQCIVCFRNKPTFAQQAMADLPAVRVTPTRAFINVGVDFMGPVYVKPPRKQAPIKAYVCVFVCMVTKATHLELVMDLTTDAFIAALKRFCGRRGYPEHIYCDNATNFVGARNELDELLHLFNTQQHKMTVAGEATRDGITFHFIPPRSPSFGGLWEACVKSTKYHFNRVTLDVLLTQEELSTTLVQIEACLNSRPLTPVTNDPSDLEPLTPGHFLIGGPLLAIPEPDLCSLPTNRLSRWQAMQRVLQSFWSRWYLEYMPTLQVVQKWHDPHANLSVGDMVLVQEENMPPTKWPIARVVNPVAGDDDSVRVADVLMGDNKTCRRSIRKMCPLPLCVDPSVDPSDDKSERQPPAPVCTPQVAPAAGSGTPPSNSTLSGVTSADPGGSRIGGNARQ